MGTQVYRAEKLPSTDLEGRHVITHLSKSIGAMQRRKFNANVGSDSQ